MSEIKLVPDACHFPYNINHFFAFIYKVKFMFMIN